jgi:hypothetical protein
MHHRARGAEQRGLARALRDHRARGVHPRRAAARAGLGPPCPRPSRARRGAGRAAPRLPETVPAEGSSSLWNIQIAVRPLDGSGSGAEILMFNSGGTGARPGLDGLSATAFPSGVSTMSVEATEQVGPIIVWRKDLREGSGGPGARRGAGAGHRDRGARGPRFPLQRDVRPGGERRARPRRGAAGRAGTGGACRRHATAVQGPPACRRDSACASACRAAAGMARRRAGRVRMCAPTLPRDTSRPREARENYGFDEEE